MVRGHAIGGLGWGRSAGKELDGVVNVATRRKEEGRESGRRSALAMSSGWRASGGSEGVGLEVPSERWTRYVGS